MTDFKTSDPSICCVQARIKKLNIYSASLCNGPPKEDVTPKWLVVQMSLTPLGAKLICPLRPWVLLFVCVPYDWLSAIVRVWPASCPQMAGIRSSANHDPRMCTPNQFQAFLVVRFKIKLMRWDVDAWWMTRSERRKVCTHLDNPLTLSILVSEGVGIPNGMYFGLYEFT